MLTTYLGTCTMMSCTHTGHADKGVDTATFFDTCWTHIRHSHVWIWSILYYFGFNLNYLKNLLDLFRIGFWTCRSMKMPIFECPYITFCFNTYFNNFFSIHILVFYLPYLQVLNFKKLSCTRPVSIPMLPTMLIMYLNWN